MCYDDQKVVVALRNERMETSTERPINPVTSTRANLCRLALPSTATTTVDRIDISQERKKNATWHVPGVFYAHHLMHVFRLETTTSVGSTTDSKAVTTWYDNYSCNTDNSGVLLSPNHPRRQNSSVGATQYQAHQEDKISPGEAPS